MKRKRPKAQIRAFPQRCPLLISLRTSINLNFSPWALKCKPLRIVRNPPNQYGKFITEGQWRVLFLLEQKVQGVRMPPGYLDFDKFFMAREPNHLTWHFKCCKNEFLTNLLWNCQIVNVTKYLSCFLWLWDWKGELWRMENQHWVTQYE